MPSSPIGSGVVTSAAAAGVFFGTVSGAEFCFCCLPLLGIHMQRKKQSQVEPGQPVPSGATPTKPKKLDPGRGKGREAWT